MSIRFKKQKILKLCVIFSWILLLCLGGYFYFTHNISIESMIFWAKNYIIENPVSGVILFIVLYVIRPLFFMIASPFDIFSGMVFGPVYGFIVSFIATFFSTMFSYGVGRITWADFIEKKQWKRLLKLKDKLHRDTFFTALMMRLLLLPYDLWNYICWVLRAPFKQYLFGTTIGLAPGTFVIVAAGAAFYGQNVQSYDTLIENIKYENLWFASGFLCTIVLVSRVLKKKFKNINL